MAENTQLPLSAPAANALPFSAGLSSNPKEAYFQLLHAWLQQAQLANHAAACFPSYMMANYPQMFAPPNALPSTQLPVAGRPAIPVDQAPNIRLGFNYMFNRNALRQDDLLDNPIRNSEIINQNGGYEYVIAPLWKRFVAEAIDVCLLFILKLVVAFMVIDLFELDFGFDFEAIRNSIEDDYTEFIFFSAEMIYIELVTKFFVCVYEAMWTRHGIDRVGGATPGKIVMGLRILYVEAVVPLTPATPAPPPPAGRQRPAPLRALIFPAQDMGFKRALMRSVAKNVLMTLMFPVCFLMLFYRNNRTSYDLATKSIVVEDNPARTLRRL